MIGIYRLLERTPIWLTALIFFAISFGAINELRDQLEGLPYQVARSAIYGDAGLFIGVLIAQTIIKRRAQGHFIILSRRLDSWRTQAVIIVACFWLGFMADILTLKSRSGQVADVYHDVVLAPVILFLVIMLLPVIFKNGRQHEKAAIVLIAAFYFGMVGLDISQSRLDQRSWLMRHGVTLQQPRFKLH